MLAGACTLKPAEAAAAAAVLGAAVSSQKDAQEFRRPDGGSLWVLRSGITFIWADTLRGPGRGRRPRRRRPRRGRRRHPGVAPTPRRWPAGRAPIPPAACTGAEGEAAGGLRSELPRARAPRPTARRARRLRGAAGLRAGPAARHQPAGLHASAWRRPAAPSSACARSPRPRSAFAARLATPTPVAHQPALLEGTGHVALAALGPSPTLLDLYPGAAGRPGPRGRPGRPRRSPPACAR